MDLQSTALKVQEFKEKLDHENIQEMQNRSPFASLLPSEKANYNQDGYPDIFRDMFLSFDKKLEELKQDHSGILLFLIAFSQGNIDQKLDCLIQVLEEAEEGDAKVELEHP